MTHSKEQHKASPTEILNNFPQKKIGIAIFIYLNNGDVITPLYPSRLLKLLPLTEALIMHADIH